MRGLVTFTLLICTVVILPIRNAASVHAADNDRPNVVVILADDLGWNSVGYHNKQFRTPHIDQLVREGVELDRFYVAPMCSPTRAGLMTGRYPIRFGAARAVIPPYRDFGLPNNELTLPERLAELGYSRRGVFGKWHLGHRRSKWHPLNHGFTHFHGHFNGAIDYFELTRDEVRDWHVDAEPSDEQGYSTHLIAAAAAQWITDSAASDAPYFCYVPFNAPHSPFQAPEETVARFTNDKTKNEQGRKRVKAKNRATLHAMIWEMDQGIGQILQSIADSGEADNTIVWFFSDNGGIGSLPRLNSPLRGSKLSVYEGGIRVPACVRWPNRLPAGTKNQRICGYIDVLPTIVEAAGGVVAVENDRPIDGISLLSGLASETSATSGSTTDAAATSLDSDQAASSARSNQRPWFSYHGQSGIDNEHLAVLHNGWKLKVNGPRLMSKKQLTDANHRIELFHLSVDPNETTNLADKHPSRVNQLGQMLLDYRKLQPHDAVPPYSVGRDGFIPPPQWRVDLDEPDALIGTYADEANQE
ncbi:Arylsulfatase precursor [Allorhodopirellula solitaria]|uniref:Arylsulfatase n=2 Tax=Allorhodopirellula solitaria TaxID=2527987 RepID=A0A5C5XWN6_9BACT|nr:Arylsulfatase precursor [Allorhodopirellula solitaria]